MGIIEPLDVIMPTDTKKEFLMCISPLYALYKKGQKIEILSKDYLDKFGFTRYNDTTFDVLSKNSQFCRDKKLIKIPCGQCVECRLEYSRTWANRLNLESMKYADNEKYFITLTYDEKYIQRNESKKNKGVYSLFKRDVQLFMKSLRQHFVKHGFNKIRFFAAGEYGDKSFRPHYHIILFGLVIPDLAYYKTSDLGFQYFVSPIISSLWKKGICVIANASWQTFNYVARYIMKKHKGNDAVFYEELGIEPEFCTMSRRPGLGLDYFNKYYKEIYENDEIYLSDSIKGGFVAKPP